MRPGSWSVQTNAGRARLKGKVAVVTGASRGAGRGIAAALGEEGATVYVTGRSTRQRSSEPLPEASSRRQSWSPPVAGRASPVDHTDDEAVAVLFDRIRDEQGRLTS